MTKSLSNWILIRALALTAVVFFLLAVTNNGGEQSKVEPQESHRIKESVLRGVPNANVPKELVDLKFSYGNHKSFRGAAADRTVLISQQAVYRLVGELKKRIALPFEIQVVFEQCGEPDAYYDKESHEIIVCYELIDVYSELFSQTRVARAGRDEATKGAVVAMFLHEVAHALIDGWNLPITGREEDAADQFSTLMLINCLPGGDEMALNSARSFELLADLERGLEKDYSGPHSLDQQRFYNTICLVYGHRPERYEYLIRNGSIPRDRAFECEENYARANKSWQTLLSPHLVRPNGLSRNSDISPSFPIFLAYSNERLTHFETQQRR